MFGNGFDYIPAAVALSTCLVLFLLVRSRKHYGNLPPGPRGYPLTGSFLELKNLKSTKLVPQYRRIYGDIFSLRVFRENFIVCTGYKILKETGVFKDRSEATADKVGLPGNGILFSNGAVWKQNRKFALHVLRDFGMGKNKIEIKIQEEVKYLLDAIDRMDGEAFDIKQILHNTVSNVISSIVFGERYDYDDKEFTELIHNLDELCKIQIRMVPVWFRYIPWDPFHVREYISRLEDMNRFYKKKINEHLTNYDATNSRDLIDTYIKQMKEECGADEASFKNDDDLRRIIHDLFAAGTETTSSALYWALVYLLRNPTIQSTIHSELDMSIPTERFPASTDKLKLPYLQATVLEILRHACIVPTVDRSPSNDTQLCGYTIPKSAVIFLDIKSVLLDNDLWEDAQCFNPSRFLGKDVSAKQLEHLIPFGTGARVCPGEALARTEIYLFLTAMLQRYEFLPPEGEGPPSLDCTSAITRRAKNFKLRAIKRPLKV